MRVSHETIIRTPTHEGWGGLSIGSGCGGIGAGNTGIGDGGTVL